MAAGDFYPRAQRLLRWPLREVLLTYLARVRPEVMAGFRHAQLLWQIRVALMSSEKPEPPPKIPRLLQQGETTDP